MSTIQGSEGLIMNQSNANSYMRVYSRGINSSGAFVRFTISAGNPYIAMMIIMRYALTQTNANDFNTATTVWTGWQVDTGGSVSQISGNSWGSGPGVDVSFSFATRQADLWIANSSVGGFPGRASINLELYCPRWDYVTVSNLN